MSQQHEVSDANPGAQTFLGLSADNSIADNIILLGNNLSLVYAHIQNIMINFDSFKKEVYGNLATLNTDIQKPTSRGSVI